MNTIKYFVIGDTKTYSGDTKEDFKEFRECRECSSLIDALMYRKLHGGSIVKEVDVHVSEN